MRVAMILVCMLVGTATAAAANAVTMHASGFGDDLWILQDVGDERVLFQRSRDDPPAALRRAGILSGGVHPHGFAAGISRVWIIQPDLSVRLVRYQRDEMSGTPRFIAPSIRPTLPTELALLDSAADRRDLWALMRGPSTSVANGPDDVSPSVTRLHDVGRDRLFRLDGTRWEETELPEAWPHGGLAQLVVAEHGEPRLIASPSPADPQGPCQVFRRDGLSWRRVEMPWPVETPSVFQAAIVDSQVVVAVASPGSAEVAMFLARDQFARLGTLPRQGEADAWHFTATAGRATLVDFDGGTLHWSQMNLQGERVTSPTELAVSYSIDIDHATDFVLWMGTLVTATMIMFLFWKRDPESNRVVLPEGMALGDLARRFSASAIDMLPCIGIAWIALGVDFDQLIARWPGHAGSVARMAPSGLVILVFVGHTMVSEIFTGRTLGKAMLGLQVVNLEGRRPELKQTLLRNVLKLLDLIAPPLLILPLAGPQRQRLGDMVARTVVVTRSDAAKGMSEGGQAGRDSGDDAKGK